MKPPVQERNYEKVKTDDFLPGMIEDVQYDKEHPFKYKGVESTAFGVRFKFTLQGYKYPHFSRWMKFNYGEKANLYKKYLVPLVDGAKPEMDFDLDQLKGMKIKTLWSEKDDFQNVETIRPAGKKLIPVRIPSEPLADMAENETHDDSPY